ncbi:MAG TPA: MFS transporter [Rhodanobacteraceae bacterium]|nr:MFS transporter [Rhodanobacteraceae bacterium]
MTRKPELSFRQIWNMCFGFLGIQFGFALQTADVSRIFQTLGADVADIPMLWIAAPLTGLIVQPIVGHCSDRTWNRLGRRRPYFLVGAVLSTLALIAMPHAPALWVAAGLLWIMDASFNISMEPFRAFVGDNLPKSQRSTGYALQSFFIGVGAVVASALPWLLAHAGVDNVAPAGAIPDTVVWSFCLGGAVLLAAVSWTVFRSREYPPEQLQAFERAEREAEGVKATPPETPVDRRRASREGLAWALIGVLGVALIAGLGWAWELYILAGGVLVYGALLLWMARARQRGMLAQVVADLYAMPLTMRRLAWVQFFSWFALFAMWIYTTAAVTQVDFGSSDPHSAAYNAGANWVGVLFAAQNGFAALAAIAIPRMARRWGVRVSHLINLWLGAAGLISFVFVTDPDWLLVSMIGIGFAWASILSLPYTLLAGSLPAAKMGVYMGIFNFFIVIPQVLAAAILGPILTTFLHGQPLYALALGGVGMVVAGLCMLRVPVAAH